MSKLAAGLIIFRKLANQIEYLLLQTSYGEHHFTPPKGHLDEGETYLDAALRETEEEAGLKPTDYKIIESFKVELKYLVNGKPKNVVYWLAKLNDPETQVKLSHEHQDYKWLKLDDAIAYAKYEDMQKVFKQVDEFIQTNHY
jgi:bis(5'-nucleosidyl)-tetraphosphatase